MMMHRNKSVDPHRFAMIPQADIPRASFDRQFNHKTTFDAGWLVPVYVDEVLPGDTFNLRMTAFARMATPIFPVMDNLYLGFIIFLIIQDIKSLASSSVCKYCGSSTNSFLP